MTWGGWISMITSIGVVVGIFGWCCWKMATTEPQASDQEQDDVVA
ncbi:MAG: hypothetical protein Q4G03_02290 [Planctomycetia bacterium]|nr:hypothetical protein [Planctomycetia bacterium]